MAAVALAVTYFADSRRFVDLRSVTANFYDGSTEKTKEVCWLDVDCTQAFRTRDVVLMKFESRDSAAKAAGKLDGKAYQSDYVVLDFTNSSTTSAEEDNMKKVLDSMKTSH
ncbi:hypothetical protein [Arthrobacter sp. AZCC_0090]|uniref:hypothetical protein n=1 Tax=Arthrobacter sp. AZCC_0090 TaxID=2735881 RepID=UPI00161D32C4|nr:hypothetical protein [Arthrobacter sp. AZCC_0090]MBB6406874.1 hypothetical protein [Arthrobacter sp. AZCC_0090]